MFKLLAFYFENKYAINSIDIISFSVSTGN